MTLNKLFSLLFLTIPFVMNAVQDSNGRCIIKSDNNVNLTFCYTDDGETVMPLLILECGKIISVGQPSEGKTSYEMKTGKRKHCHNQYKEHLSHEAE